MAKNKYGADNYQGSGMSKGAFLRAQKSGQTTSKKGGSLSTIVDEILGATPGFNTPSKTFDQYYGEKQQKEDRKASEAMFNPWYEKKIADTMEDLNSYAEMDSINYKRTLRQGRAKMAQLGGAIGSERTTWEDQVTTDKNNAMNNKLRKTERVVGSDAMMKAGYSSFYNGSRIGSLIDERNASIEDQVLWYRDQALGNYNSSVNATYKAPSSKNYLGENL